MLGTLHQHNTASSVSLDNMVEVDRYMLSLAADFIRE